MFFKAVVQAVLLYGSETWVLTDSALRCLEGFYYRAACRMARRNRPKKNERTGEWRYPDKKELFEEVGLYTLTEYIEKRRKTIGAYIRDRPILDLCRDGERQRGTSKHRGWWDQPFEADPEREEDASPTRRSIQIFPIVGIIYSHSSPIGTAVYIVICI